MCEHGEVRELCQRFFELGVQVGRDERLTTAVDAMLSRLDHPLPANVITITSRR